MNRDRAHGCFPWCDAGCFLCMCAHLKYFMNMPVHRQIISFSAKCPFANFCALVSRFTDIHNYTCAHTHTHAHTRTHIHTHIYTHRGIRIRTFTRSHTRTKPRITTNSKYKYWHRPQFNRTMHVHAPYPFLFMLLIGFRGLTQIVTSAFRVCFKSKSTDLEIGQITRLVHDARSLTRDFLGSIIAHTYTDLGRSSQRRRWP